MANLKLEIKRAPTPDCPMDQRGPDILQLYLDGDEVPFAGSMARAQKRLGMNAELQLTLDPLVERSETQFIPAYSIGIIYAALDRYEEAIAKFQESHEKNEPMIVLMNHDELLEPIFDDPRIQWAIRVR